MTDKVEKTKEVKPDSREDRLYDAVSHLRKGGTLSAEVIDDLLDFIKPTPKAKEPKAK